MSIEHRKGSVWVAVGALNGFLTVALGAFAAHGLKDSLSARMLEVFEKGVEYQGLHALALIAVGLLMAQYGQAAWFVRAGIAFSLGIVLFSGSLYLLAITGVGAFGVITPLGGSSFLLGWAFLCWGSWCARRSA